MAVDPESWNAKSSAGRVIALLARVVRSLQTNKRALSRTEKFARCIALFPVFSLLVLILRVRVLLGRPPLDLVTRTPDGFVFRCRPPDLIQMYIWLFGVWEPELTEYIGEQLKPGDVFLDVGANIGYFSVLAAERVQPAGGVVAVEASPAVFKLLEEAIELNGDAGVVRCVNVAAAGEAGAMPVYAGPTHNIGLSTTVAERGFVMEGMVPTTPLDAVLRPGERGALRMIKIDVEGAEPDVLRGMDDLIRNSPDNLEVLIELSPDWWSDSSLTVHRVLDKFLRGGFNVYEIRNTYWPWRYLWPRSVPRPARRRSELPQRGGRLDLILSRRDAERL